MSTIIFDFDGTIADSFGKFADVLHEISGRGDPLQRVPEEVIERMRGMSLRNAAKEVDFPLWKVPFIMPKGLRLMRSTLGSTKACAGVPEAITALQKQGYDMYILSTNSVKNIELFLERHHIRDTFSQIYGNVGLFSKARVLKRIMRRNNLTRNDIVYIGDEVRDIEAAKRADVRVIAVTWGYNKEPILRQHEPTAVASSAQELSKTIRSMLQ